MSPSHCGNSSAGNVKYRILARPVCKVKDTVLATLSTSTYTAAHWYATDAPRLIGCPERYCTPVKLTAAVSAGPRASKNCMLVPKPAGPTPTKVSAAAISPRSSRVKVKRHLDPGRITACDMQARQSAAGAATRCTPPSFLVNRRPLSQHPASKVCSVRGGMGSGSASSSSISTVSPRCLVDRACLRPSRTVFSASGFNPLLCITSNPFGENITRATHRELK
mmetsp:Transcript_43300/g.94288  ORF Transcript_43300/g.94288 Transcript_43300/m.94288 type:complete len:222 (-) Transcript_43300:60-725(-)